MAGSLTDIQATLQTAVVALNRLTRQLTAVFPQATAVSTLARGSVGAVTFTSSQATGFLSVTTSSGFVGWVALYPSS